MKNEKDITQSIFDSSEYIVTLKDKNLCYIRCSVGFLGLTNEKNYEGKKQQQLILCKNYKTTDKILNLVLKKKKPQTFIQEIFIDNQKHFFKSTATPVFENKKVTAILTISQDITEAVSLQYCFENYDTTLRHNLQISAIAQFRALEFLLSGKMGDFNNEQKELLELTFNSCHYLYKTVKNLLMTYKLTQKNLLK